MNLKIPIAFLGGIIVYLVGGENMNLLYAIATLCGIDTLIAMYAISKGIYGRFTSKKFPQKLFTFVKYVLAIIAMHMLAIINSKLSWAVDVVAVYAGISEATSILEHLALFGYKIPLPLLKDLKKDINQ